MSQRIIRRLVTAGAVAALLAAGPVQARESPRETGPLQRWLGGLEKHLPLGMLRFWTRGKSPEKAGHLVDPNGRTAPGSNTPGCQGCTDQGFLIDPDG
jgi:outer membrane biogenesis lipoprotein LolB